MHREGYIYCHREGCYYIARSPVRACRGLWLAYIETRCRCRDSIEAGECMHAEGCYGPYGPVEGSIPCIPPTISKGRGRAGRGIYPLPPAYPLLFLRGACR